MLRSLLVASLAASSFMTAASAVDETSPTCAATEPLRAAPTDAPDSGLMGLWYVNGDRTIWAGWDAVRMRAGQKGNKVLWFRPKGTQLVVSARRLDAEAAPAQIDIACCYGGRLQASGLSFPSAACWEISAKAGESELLFVTRVGAERPAH